MALYDMISTLESMESERQNRARELLAAREALAQMREWMNFTHAYRPGEWANVLKLVHQAIELRRSSVPAFDFDGTPAAFAARRPETDAEMLARLEKRVTDAAERLAEATAAVAKQVPA